MIKLAIFDVNGVLASRRGLNEYFIKEYSAFLKRHNATEPKDSERQWRRLVSEIHSGNITLRDARLAQMKKMGIDGKYVREYERIDEEQLKMAKLMEPGEKASLLKLKKMGCKLAALSDTIHGHRMLARKMDQLGIGRLIDRVFASSEIGHEKPHRRAYEAVLRSFRVKPEEAVFVGHDDDEMLGAKRLGIKAVSYRQSRKGDFLIRSFSGLPRLIERLDRQGDSHPPK